MFAKTRLAAAILAATLSLAAQAQQGVDLSLGFTDYTAWSLHGDATATVDRPGNGFIYSNLSLTAANGLGSAGAGFAPAALAIDFDQPFFFAFNFFIPVSSDVRGDGFTFVLSSQPGMVGNGGSGLGYEGLGSDSLAFAVDTFHFDGEPVSPSVQILAGGSVTPLAATETGLGDAIRDPDYQWRAEIRYTPSGLEDASGLFSGTISHLDLGSFSVQASLDFGPTGLAMAGAPVWWGFTGANGLAQDRHFITSATAVPEPGAAALMLLGLTASRFIARRRRPR
jgi:hypothetical protein